MSWPVLKLFRLSFKPWLDYLTGALGDDAKRDPGKASIACVSPRSTLPALFQSQGLFSSNLRVLTDGNPPRFVHTYGSNTTATTVVGWASLVGS